MSAGSVSLTSSINVCRVGSGEAERLESDRFLNPMNMVCPIWGGTNLKGQQVCPDSFQTKRAGCNSAMDRVLVESNLRPDYASFVTLNMAGLKGEIFGNPSARDSVNGRTKMLQHTANNNPNYGKQFGSNIASRLGGRGKGPETDYGSCSINAYERAMAQEAQSRRQQGAANNYSVAHGNMSHSGSW